MDELYEDFKSTISSIMEEQDEEARTRLLHSLHELVSNNPELLNIFNNRIAKLNADLNHYIDDNEFKPSWEYDDNLPEWRNRLLSTAFNDGNISIPSIEASISVLNELEEDGYAMPSIATYDDSLIMLTMMTPSSTVFLIVTDDEHVDCWHAGNDNNSHLECGAGDAFVFIREYIDPGEPNIME